MISYLQIDKLTKSFGDLVLFEDITFGVAQGQKIGLIAKNGTGKTTLLNIIGGKEDYDSGEVVFRKDLRVGYLEQSPSYPEELTVLQACFHSKNETVRLIAEYEEAMAKEDHSNLEDILTRMDSFKAWDYEQKAKQILGQLKIHNFNQKIGELSGGQLKRVALANVLITDPELIILDEPTNHLDLEMTEWLEDYLSRANISILMVTHDRYFLDRVCSEIIEIDNKQIYSYKGNYSYYLEKRQERVEAMNADVERAKNLLRTELDWMRRQPQARATKARSRIDAFHELETRLQSTRSRGEVRLDVKASRIGTKIFEAKEVGKRFGELVLLDKFNYNFTRYEKLGIVGDNGCGKSTLLRMIAGLENISSGELWVDGEIENYKEPRERNLAMVFQNYALYPNMSVYDNIAFSLSVRKVDKKEIKKKVYDTAKMLGIEHLLDRRPGELSGGQKQRVAIGNAIIRNPRALLMDEPLSNLDAKLRTQMRVELAALQHAVEQRRSMSRTIRRGP